MQKCHLATQVCSGKDTFSAAADIAERFSSDQQRDRMSL
jgi:hypothetical protein